MANTLEYYNNNAEQYALSTVDCRMDEAIDEFLRYVGASGILLDFGCGSGRDSKVFLSKGYDVVSADGSYEMCQEAERFLNHRVKHMLFSELSDENYFDGIWACASILHLPYEQLKSVLFKMYRALKQNGVVFASFRHGDMEGLRGERYFTDMNEEKLERLLFDSDFKLIKSWVSKDSRLDRLGDEWFSFLLIKK